MDDIVNKYYNIYYSTIKIKPADEKSSPYIDFKKENNKEDLKFELGDRLSISKQLNNFVKGYTPN